jgi:hypothetical protein
MKPHELKKNMDKTRAKKEGEGAKSDKKQNHKGKKTIKR